MGTRKKEAPDLAGGGPFLSVEGGHLQHEDACRADEQFKGGLAGSYNRSCLRRRVFDGGFLFYCSYFTLDCCDGGSGSALDMLPDVSDRRGTRVNRKLSRQCWSNSCRKPTEYYGVIRYETVIRRGVRVA